MTSENLEQCTIEIKYSPILKRVWQAAINVGDKLIYMTGGAVAGRTTESCDVYDIE